MKNSYKNNKLKTLVPKQNNKFHVPDGSYFVLDNEDYFEYIIKNNETVTDNTSIRKYVNKIEIGLNLKGQDEIGQDRINRIIFKTIKRDYLKLLLRETMKLHGCTKNKIVKGENGENVPHLEISEVVLVHCNTASNDYQHDSRDLQTFVSNKLFNQLLDILPKAFGKIFNLESSYIE